MARDRIERGLLVVQLDVDRAGRAAADLMDRRDVGVAQFARRLDVHAAFVPAGDMPRIAECDPGIFLQDLVDGDPEPCGTDGDVLERALRRLCSLSRGAVFAGSRSRLGSRMRRLCSQGPEPEMGKPRSARYCPRPVPSAWPSCISSIRICQSENCCFNNSAKMRFQGAERGDQDARRRFLAHPAPRPPLLQCPFLERSLPANHVPQARPRG